MIQIRIQVPLKNVKNGKRELVNWLVGSFLHLTKVVFCPIHKFGLKQVPQEVLWSRSILDQLRLQLANMAAPAPAPAPAPAL